MPASKKQERPQRVFLFEQPAGLRGQLAIRLDDMALKPLEIPERIVKRMKGQAAEGEVGEDPETQADDRAGADPQEKHVDR